MADARTPVVVVAGWNGAVAATADTLLAREGTVVVKHDLSELGQGIVRRTCRTRETIHTSVLELAHGCVSCTMREDLLPLLRRLHSRSGVRRIVIEADSALEPEALCWALDNMLVTGAVGLIDGPASRDVRIDAVITCVDAATWLSDATGDETVAERGYAAADGDERTVAQVCVGQVEYADAVIVTGSAADGWQQARLYEIFRRLAPAAAVDWVGERGVIDAERVLREIPDSARRGAVSDPHGPLLRGEPPLAGECGVTLVEFSAARPFHPQRLHDAMDVLLDGVISSRGRLWLATQNDEALWLESAGGGLRVAAVGQWLAAMPDADQAEQSAERLASAALRWDAQFGDRHNAIVALSHEADPEVIYDALSGALLTDLELALGPELWTSFSDPFGEYHEDPCGDTPEQAADTSASAQRRHGD